MIGRPIIRLDAVSSTQDTVFRLVALGAGEGTTVVAGYQSGGRGRAGRAWVAPPGQALLFSILFRPQVPPHRLSPLSILVADAISTTLAREFGLDPAIKWPNDVLVGGRKLCGILIQARPGVAVAGIGLNVSIAPSELPDGATSLDTEAGYPVDRDALLHALLRAIGERYDDLLRGDLDDAMARVDARLHLKGEQVTLQDGDRTLEGRVRGVREDGALLLEVDGALRAIVSGELTRGPRPVMP